MYYSTRLALLLLASLFPIYVHSQSENSVSQELYVTGSEYKFAGTPDRFVGDVLAESLFPSNDTSEFSGAVVTFAPGARTAWHSHPAGQHMIVTEGTGLTGTRNGDVIEFSEGEVVWCPPDIDHWHGATPHSSMAHLVIIGIKDGDNVTWKENVSDDEYYSAAEKVYERTPEVVALTTEQQQLIPVAAFTANGDQASLKMALEKALENGLTINEIKEIQIHLYAYVGFPRALNGLSTFMSLLEQRRAQGIEDEMGEAPQPLPDDQTSVEFGKAVQTELVGRPVSGPLFDFAPAINTFLQGHLFGDLFGRGILDYQAREIVTVSALSSIDGAESQLGAHVFISNNVGLNEEQLLEVAKVLEKSVGKKEGLRARHAVERRFSSN